MKVLIVRIGAMGDVLHAMPAVAALRQLHPGWTIGWVIEPRWSNLLQIAGDTDDLTQGVALASGTIVRRGLVDSWYSASASAWRKRPFARATRIEIFSLRDLLRAERFDLVVDMQGAIKSAVVGRMARSKKFVGAAAPRERVARHLYTQRVALTAQHVVEQGCELLGAAIGEALAPAHVTLPMSEQAEHWADAAVGPAADRDRFCLISPGGGWGSKVWPAERLGRVAAELARSGVRTVVNASLNGSREADEVVAASDGAARAIPCNIPQLIALTRRAAVVIAGDTGPLHLAAALERPVVGIYGPTDPARNGPYAAGSAAARFRVLRDTESTTSHKRRHQAEPGMLHISVEQVVGAARELLA